MRKYIWLIATAFIVNCSSSVLAQITFSPYTEKGIGDISSTGFSNNLAMGGVGIATPTFWHINNQNPALLTYNTLSVFQMGVAGESRIIDTELTSQQNGMAGIKYLAFAFPIMNRKWSTSFGILPYSSVSYNTISNDTVEGSTIPLQKNDKGSGGISRAYFANGFTLFDKINVGVRASYLFGFVERSTLPILGDSTFVTPFQGAIFERVEYKGFKFTAGLAYRHTLSENSFLNFGLIYESKADLDGERLIRLERRNAVDNALPVKVITSGEQGTFSAPSQLGFGISWEKLNKFTLALDIKHNKWSKTPEFSDDINEYRSALFLGLGFEIIPDYTSVNSFFKRIRYRVGASFEQLPYLVQNQKINDFGINFGWSLPVNASSLDMGFKYGQRGRISDNLIRERYFKFVLGATINDRWFVRRKYD